MDVLGVFGAYNGDELGQKMTSFFNGLKVLGQQCNEGGEEEVVIAGLLSLARHELTVQIMKVSGKTILFFHRIHCKKSGVNFSPVFTAGSPQMMSNLRPARYSQMVLILHRFFLLCVYLYLFESYVL